MPRTHTIPRVALVLGLGLVPSLGCRDGSGDPPSAEDASTGGDGDGDGTSGEGDTGVDACESAPARVGLQRLTRAEYNRTVRDLFGVTSNPADAFPPDSSTDGFDNNAKSLTVSPQLASLLLGAAESIAAEAVATQLPTLLPCDPAVLSECTRDSVAAIARRVYRRPPSDAELDDLMVLVDLAATEGDPVSAGIENAIIAMLMSPQFLYRSVPSTDAAPEAGVRVVLDDWALATRLSYFLWGSTPDDDLLARAAEGALQDEDALRLEFERMLADPKASAFYDGFVAQWLQLGKLGAATPDVAVFPAFDEALRQAMADETRLFFDDLRARDGSPLEIVTGTATFANAGTATIYGVPGIAGDAMVPITTDPTQRAGVLTMPAVLTMTSGPSAPNIVRRGVWLAEAILCLDPPPPPVGVPPAPEPIDGESERERLERHREDPSCASCHDLIDPLGFGFENYDAIGAWRDEADGESVDNAGALPDGRTFAGMVELGGLLATSSDFPTCMTSKVMTYALGRTVTPDDACVVEAIGAETVTADSALSELLWAVVTSDAFRTETATTEDT